MDRVGIDRETGQLLAGWDDCVQSIGVILTTRIGWRVMRRRFGSRIRDLQDLNPAPATLLRLYVAIAEALRLWEPGFRLTKVAVTRIGADGVALFEIEGRFYPRGHLGDFGVGELRVTRLSANDNGFRVEKAA
jgi:phage baseplate assembly protein W